MMMTEYMLTIIIPHYNMPDMLERLLESAVGHSGVQIIVADDASDTGMPGLERCMEKYKDRVTFLISEDGRKGAGGARNCGLDQALGKWILFADADDILAEGWYEAVSRYFESDYDIVFFTPSGRHEDPRRTTDRHEQYVQRIDDYLKGCPGGEERLRCQFYVPWSKLIRTEMIRRNGIRFEEIRYSNDLLFSVKAGCCAGKIAADRNVIYCVTEHIGSLTEDRSAEAFIERAEAACRMEEYLRKNRTKEQRILCGRLSSLRYLVRSAVRGYGFENDLRLLRLFRRYRVPLAVPEDVRKARNLRRVVLTEETKKRDVPEVTGSKIRWERGWLMPLLYDGHLRSYIRKKKYYEAKRNACIEESESEIRIQMPDAGKVTDCGYDNAAFIYTAVPADSDFCFEADVTVDSFLREPGPTNREAFGICVRDIVKRDEETGLFYADMIGVGGYRGRYNIFGREGTAAGKSAPVRNIVMYHDVNRPGGAFSSSPMRYAADPAAPLRARLMLCRKGGTVTAGMIDENGQDLLEPVRNGGETELNSGEIRRAGGGYEIHLPESLRKRSGFLYAGFLAAGASMTVKKDTVRLLVEGKADDKTPAVPEKEVCPGADPFAESVDTAITENETLSRVLCAAPDGAPDGDGSRERPYDLQTAAERCPEGGQVRLKAGRYLPETSVILGNDSVGAAGTGKRFSGPENREEKAVIDFGGRPHALLVRGDHWTVENIEVTNGYGIKVEGSYNRIYRCIAGRNAETGIQIRHGDDGSERREWPGYNIVEECAAYENRDVSECNADGFACKVSAGEGNVFRNCVSFLNADDGFDLYSKNRAIGAVRIENCGSFLNGYKESEEGRIVPAGGNGNGFKLGGSGMFVRHSVSGCEAEANKGCGFTSNSNPYMRLEACNAGNNGHEDIHYAFYYGKRVKHEKLVKDCREEKGGSLSPEELLARLRGRYCN